MFLLHQHPFISSNLTLLFCSIAFFFLQSIKRKDDPQEVKVQMQFMIYGTRPSKDKSGAYLFLPDGKAKVFSQQLFLRFLPACQKPLIISLGYCVIASHWGARGRKPGRLDAFSSVKDIRVEA